MGAMGGGWNRPNGIAVRDWNYDNTGVYITEGDDSDAKVKRCSYMIYGKEKPKFECFEFGRGWNSPRGVAVDAWEHVFVTNAYSPHYGVWKCNSHAVCTLIGDSDRWPLTPDCLAADPQGNVYITGGYEDSGESNYVKKCTSTGVCSDFSGDWPKGGGYDNSIAVDPHNNVFICDAGTQTLIKCSTDNVCENLGAFGCDGGMTIDKQGILYTADSHGLNMYCLPSLIDSTIQV